MKVRWRRGQGHGMTFMSSKPTESCFHEKATVIVVDDYVIVTCHVCYEVLNDPYLIQELDKPDLYEKRRARGL